MIFYFDTPDQKLGDAAFNAGDYDTALQHYVRGLETLTRQISPNDRSTLPEIYDSQFFKELAFVQNEILITRVQIVSNIFSKLEDTINADNLKSITTHWQEIRGALDELATIYEKRNKQNELQKLNELYVDVADICEDMSDLVSDILEEDNEDITLLLDPTLLNPLTLMSKAIELRNKAQEPIEVSCHLGYLNLLELEYKTTKNLTYINAMKKHINEAKLLTLDLSQSPIEELELLSYAIRIAKVKSQNFSALSERCKTIYNTLPEQDKDNTIIDDLNKLIGLELSSQMDSSTTEEETRVATGNFEEAEIEMQLEEPLIPRNTRSFFDTPPVLPSSDMRDNESSSEDEVVTMELEPSLTSAKRVEKDSQDGRSSPHGFFTPKSLVNNEPSRNEAFIEAISSLVSNSTAPKPKYLANLLSLIADFFADNQELSSTQRKTLAYSLYSQACLFDPTNSRANKKRSHVGNTYKVNDDTAQILSTNDKPSSKRDFMDIIDTLTSTLEKLSPKNANILFDDLIKKLDTDFTKGTITNGPCPEIAKSMTSIYRHALKPKLPSSMFE